MGTIAASKETLYIDTNEDSALGEFSEAFYNFIKYKADEYGEIIILCIGTDRVTGDSLGPLVGYKLTSSIHNLQNVKIFGTLEKPVHAKNIKEHIEDIYKNYSNPLVIAIDACLGKFEHIGCLTIEEGSMSPGAGVDKELPSIGDISITGIVNFYGSYDRLALQNTRLNLIMNMADIIHNGIICGLLKMEMEYTQFEKRHGSLVI